MFVMDCYGHKLSNGVLFAHHLILDVPGGSSHLGYRRRVPLGHNPPTRVKNVAAVIFPDLRRELYRLKEYRPPECENLESRAYSRPAGPPH